MLKLKQYSVTGKGCFPRDMLRYDSAAIVDPTTRAAIEVQTWEAYAMPVRTIQIEARACTAARWLSFGWAVS